MLANHPSIDIGQSTEYAKEMRKWESTHTKYGPPGRPYLYSEYGTQPDGSKGSGKRMYKCRQEAGKGIVIEDAHTVHSEHEERNLRSRGFSPTLQEAAGACESAHTEHGKLAAEREYEIRHGHHSERAVAEVRQAEVAVSGHLPAVPETPIPTHRKRGRKPKATVPVEA